MRNWKKRSLALGLTAALLLPFTACNGGGDAASQAENSAGGNQSVTQLTWTVWDGGDVLKVYQKICEDYNAKQSKNKVKVVSIPDEYDTKITAMVASNQAPDIAAMESATLLYPMAEEGKIVNLLDLMKKDSSFNTDSLLPQIKYMKDPDFMAAYGMGAELMTMFYNPKLFQKAGVAEPPAKYSDAWDWDTFVKNAKLLTIDKNGKNASESGFDPKSIKQYGVRMDQWWPIWGSFIASVGGDYLSEDGKQLTLTDPKNEEVLQKIVDLIYVHHVCPTPASGQSLPGLSEAITTGKVAMSIGGQWDNFALMEDGVEYNVAALPKMGEKARTMITAGATAIFNGKNVDAAWDFFKFLYSPGATLPLEESGSWLPTLKDMYTPENEAKWLTDDHPSNYKDAIATPLEDGTAVAPYTSYIVNFSKIQDILTPAFDKAWSGQKSVKDALAEVAAKASAEVKGRRDK